MGKAKMRPTYDLEEIKQLVADEKYTVASRPARFVWNHLGDPSVFIPDIIASIESGDFKKSMELDVKPGTYADVYICEYDDDDWYVKFYANGEGGLAVVLSCNWDGAGH